MTDREAAEYWGVSRQWVNALRHRLEVPRPPNQFERVRQQVEALAHRGLSTAEIARALGLNPGRVARLRPNREPGLAPCGTRTAYNRHRRRGEPVDEACRPANNESAARRRRAAGRKDDPLPEAGTAT